MAKSLPSLSAFLPTKKNVPDNITDQVLLGCAKKNDEGKQNICLHEMLFTQSFVLGNVAIANGSKTINNFNSTAQKYSMLPSIPKVRI